MAVKVRRVFKERKNDVRGSPTLHNDKNKMRVFHSYNAVYSYISGQKVSAVDNSDYVKYTNSRRYIKHSESLCHEYFFEDKMMGIRGTFS